VRKSKVHHNWRRPLPRPIVIPKVMTLSTLEDSLRFTAVFSESG
jgi:hypothetical protein